MVVLGSAARNPSDPNLLVSSIISVESRHLPPSTARQAELLLKDLDALIIAIASSFLHTSFSYPRLLHRRSVPAHGHIASGKIAPEVLEFLLLQLENPNTQ